MGVGLIGNSAKANARDFGEDIAWADHSIKFYVEHARGKDVLDIGCVMHDPESYRSRYWVHKALKEVSASLIGIDLYEDGVRYLSGKGYDIRTADAQAFDMGQQFDIIVAGEIIEHLENFSGFIECCKRHLRPNGAILISTPNPWFWKNVVRAGLNPEIQNNPEHTCWLCPRTLRQLLARHSMGIYTLKFGSRYWPDRLMPLPVGWRHTTFHAEVRRAEP